MPPNGQEIEPKLLRRAFGQFATGVCVVGMQGEDGAQLGATVNSFTSVSLEPALLLVSLGHHLKALDAMLRAPGFGISVLSDSQQGHSNTFATSGASKWQSVAPIYGEQGGLLLPDALAHFDCAMHDTVLAGDHTLLIGRILSVTIQPERRPLLYFQGKYDALAVA